nr:3-keto-5-aminohexanoate cleavage protein [Halorubrum lipolyticum]
MTYDDYLDGKSVIVTAALTGGVHGKEAHPDLPEMPAEIAAAAAACEAASRPSSTREGVGRPKGGRRGWGGVRCCAERYGLGLWRCPPQICSRLLISERLGLWRCSLSIR